MSSRARVFPPSDKLCDLLAEVAGAKVDESAISIFEVLSDSSKVRKLVGKKLYNALLVAIFDENCHDVDIRDPGRWERIKKTAGSMSFTTMKALMPEIVKKVIEL